MARDIATTKYKQLLATQMRLQGMSYGDIASEVGYRDKSGAWRAVQRSLSSGMRESGESLWAKQMADLDLLQERAWPTAMAGNQQSISRCVRIIESRVRLALRQ